MVTSRDPELARKVRLLREYGWSERYVSQIPGWNSRLDELQAAVLRVKLRHLDADNAVRGRVGQAYDAALADCGLRLPAIRPGSSHVFHLYVVRCSDRERVRQHLQQRGIAAGIHYPVPVHEQPAYLARFQCILPNTESAANEVLSLPIYPELSGKDVDAVIDAVTEFFRGA